MLKYCRYSRTRSISGVCTYEYCEYREYSYHPISKSSTYLLLWVFPDYRYFVFCSMLQILPELQVYQGSVLRVLQVLTVFKVRVRWYSQYAQYTREYGVPSILWPFVYTLECGVPAKCFRGGATGVPGTWESWQHFESVNILRVLKSFSGFALLIDALNTASISDFCATSTACSRGYCTAHTHEQYVGLQYCSYSQ